MEVTSDSGCETVTSIVVDNILPSVATPLVTNNGPVCENETIELSILQNFVGNVVEYQWINGEGRVVSNARTVSLPANGSDAISPFTVQVMVDGCGYSTGIQLVE